MCATMANDLKRGKNVFPNKRNNSEKRNPVSERRRKGDVVERALQNVKELAKLAHDDGNEDGLPYGDMRWIRKKRDRDVPIDKEKIQKYSRGEGLSKEVFKDGKLKKIKTLEKDIEFSIEQAARTEILLTEDAGYLEVDDGETSTQFTQKQIVNSVDVLSASKHFELFLEEYGPYRVNYTRNGQYLLLGGRKGHLAAFQWVTKNPACEINVMEEIFDVQWLHNETMFAVAQKKWVYLYDSKGVEIHCIKNLHNILRLDFLPYHFLLACSSATGYLAWLDVSIGKMVAQFPIKYGRLNIMAQNPYNAILCLGHSAGTVTMWSPNSKDALVKMLCHQRPVQAIAINQNGMYMATSAVDSTVRIWDLRQLNGPLQDYRIHGVASNLSFGDRSVLAMSIGNVVEVYRDCCVTTANQAYLRHKVKRPVSDIQFCPFEDILGVGSSSGFSSIIVPGAGEPNFDALENNPFQSKSQRQEAEVKSLLEKIQPELITLDPWAIGDIDVPTLQEKLEAKKNLMLGKMPDVDFTPRRKGKSKGSVHAAKTKNLVKERARREFVKAVKEVNEEMKKSEEPEPEVQKQHSVLDRFLPKKKKK